MIIKQLWDQLVRLTHKSHENLKVIRFEGQMLPNWAQLLDLAASLSPVDEETRRWFSRLTNATGVEDARIVLNHCTRLRGSLEANREMIRSELCRHCDDSQPAQILGGWNYALDTMIEEARTKTTCSWMVEGTEQSDDNSSGGDIGLRRV